MGFRSGTFGGESGNGGGGSTSASGVSFDPAGSDLTSTDVQNALIEVSEQVPTFLMRFWRPVYDIVDDDVDTTADTITMPAHRVATGTTVSFDATWGGFTSGTPYYAIRVDEDTIQVATTLSDALAGAARDITGLPGGAITLTSTNGHHIFAGRIHKTKAEMTYSIADADVDPTANTITIPNHPFHDGHGIQFESAWGGFSTGTLYYAIVVDPNTIKIANSYYNSQIGTAFDITGDPGGTVNLFGTYGNFYFDAFVTPELGAEYPLSIGYGGSHIILFGFTGGSAGRIGLTGNVSPALGGSVDVNLSSGSESAFIGYPVHIAAMETFGYIVLFFNGVPTRRFAKTTGRGAELTSDAGCYIGGSDHSNFEGDMFWVRLFENRVPIYYDPASAGCLRVSPRPVATYYEAVTTKYITANLLLNFAQPSTTVANLGKPLYPDRTNHGRRAAGTDADIFSDFNSFEEWELPQQIRAPLPTRPTYDETPPAVPEGAEVFDSFTRNYDITYFWGNYLGLGSTEGGSLGVKRWKQTHPGAPRHGVLFNRAFVEGTGTDATREYVDLNSPYKKVEIVNNGNETIGVVLFIAYDFATDTGFKAVHGDLDTISLYRMDAGVPTGLGYYVIPGDNAPYTLGIEYTSTEQVKLLIDGVAQVTYDDSANTAQTGVSVGFTSSVGFCRVDRITVYAASA